MLESLTRLVVGLGVSVVGVVVLLPVAVALAKVFRRALGCGPLRRFSALVGREERRTVLADKVETAVIGGLIGGIVFASLNPALAPVLADVQVESGVVDEPNPAVDVRHLGAVSNESIERTFNVSADANHSVYVLSLANGNHRTLEKYNLNVRFSGCVRAAAVDATNFGTAAVANRSQELELGEFANRSANATCYGALSIEEFPPGHSALVTFLVDETPSAGPERLYPEPAQAGTAYLSTAYSWSYDGRTYYEPSTLKSVPVANATEPT